MDWLIYIVVFLVGSSIACYIGFRAGYKRGFENSAVSSSIVWVMKMLKHGINRDECEAVLNTKVAADYDELYDKYFKQYEVKLIETDEISK